MKEILAFIDQKQQKFRQLPFFEFLQNSNIDPRQRLAFAPGIAAFTMNFSELNKTVFRDEETTDKVQEIVNIHTYEDDCHWPWLLNDLKLLGLNQKLSLNDALKFFWSEETVKSREAANFLYRTTFQAKPLQKYVVIEATEATANVFLKMTAIAAEELQKLTKQEYLYFGSSHYSADSTHTSFSSESRDFIESIQLSEDDQAHYIDLVNQTFDVFTDFMGELLAFAKNNKVEYGYKLDVGSNSTNNIQLFMDKKIHSPYQEIKPLGSYLIEANLVTSEQVEKALDEQVTTSMKLGEVLVKHGCVSQETVEYIVKKVVHPERQRLGLEDYRVHASQSH